MIMRKNKCPLCGELKCENRLCHNIMTHYGVYTLQGAKVSERGMIKYEQLKQNANKPR